MIVADAKAALARGGKLVGALVYWQGLDEAGKLGRDLFRAGMTEIGLVDALVATPKPEALLHSAVAEARTSYKGTRPFDFELKRKDDERATYALVRRWDDVDRVRYLEDGAISVRRGDGGCWHDVHSSVDDAAANEVREILWTAREVYLDRRDHLSAREVSGALVRAMRCLRALPMRNGVFLVPGHEIERLDALGRLVGELLPGVAWSAWRITDNGANLATARRDARAAFLEQIDGLAGRVTEFVARVPSVRDADPRSLAVFEREFRDLAGVVGLWTDVLGDQQAMLTQKLVGAKHALLAAYFDGVEAAS